MTRRWREYFPDGVEMGDSATGHLDGARSPTQMKARAIRIHETGGPEVLRWEEVDVSNPGPGEVLLRQTASA